jgi:ferredoxin
MFPLFIDPGTCRHCGLCVKLCPVGHLTMTSAQSIVSQGDSCILCQRCFAYCPSGAITIGKKETIRYHAVPLTQMQLYLGRK